MQAQIPEGDGKVGQQVQRGTRVPEDECMRIEEDDQQPPGGEQEDHGNQCGGES